jgi:hypothetical protein
MSNDPAATAVTIGTEVPEVCQEAAQITTTSPAATLELVTVNSASAQAASEVLSVVIVPERAFTVTPVVRLVACVTELHAEP